MIVTPVKLTQPEHLPEENWQAVAVQQERLHAAIARKDHSDVIGQMKSLVECIARVTFELSGTSSTETDFVKQLNGAHNRLATQPGSDLSTIPAFFEMANSGKTMVSQLGKIRNAIGTGHGHAQVPEARDDATNLCVDAGMTWSRWALGRLDVYAFGRPTDVMNDLLGGVTFTRGLLAERLTAANIPRLDEPQQRALGVAVGHRAASGTFVVREDGIEVPSQDGTLDPWTIGYRLGAASGLLRSAAGNWTINAHTFDHAVNIISAVPDREVLDWLKQTTSALYVDQHYYNDSWCDKKLSVVVDRTKRSRPDQEECLWDRFKEFILPDT